MMHELGFKCHKTASQLEKTVSWTMGFLQLSNHVVQNHHTGEQMTHWDTLKKATKFESSLFNMFQCIICSPVWMIFVPREHSTANGPFPLVPLFLIFRLILIFYSFP